MSTEWAGDAACTISKVQDLIEAAGTDPVEAVQDLRPAVAGIVALITDFTLQLLLWRAVFFLQLSLRAAHLQLMFWKGKERQRDLDRLRKREKSDTCIRPGLNRDGSSCVVVLNQADFFVISLSKGKVSSLTAPSLFLLLREDLWIGSWVRVTTQGLLWQGMSLGR